MNRIYLDHNATTPLAPEALDAMTAAWRSLDGNPSSQHAAGRRARRLLDDARERIATLLGAGGDELRAAQVVFTSGGTEANNQALLHLAAERPGQVVISAIEHPSITAAADELERRGAHVERLPVDRHGAIELDRLAELLERPTRLVSLMAANNETGVVQPLAAAARLCAARGVPLHTDAAQAVGKGDLNFRALGLAALTLAPHKFHGPVGVGLLVVERSVTLAPLLYGGHQQHDLRPGTEPVALAVGAARALELALEHPAEQQASWTAARDRFEHTLTAELPEATVIGVGAPRLPHVSNIAFEGVDRQALFMALDLLGVACSTGSACASGSSEPSQVHAAMGLPASLARGALRFSFGRGQGLAEAVEASRRIVQCVNNLRRQKRP